MEKAFLKGLKHALSKKYQDRIVADRGFGNERFLGACKEVGIDFLSCVTPSLKIFLDEKGEIMEGEL